MSRSHQTERSFMETFKIRPKFIEARTQQDLGHVGGRNYDQSAAHSSQKDPNQSCRNPRAHEPGRGGGVVVGCFTCVKVLAGLVGVHGAVTDGGLYRPQWRDYASAGKELVDGRA